MSLSGLAADATVKISALNEQVLPLVVEPAEPGMDLESWAAQHREWIESTLMKYGGILFRNFPVREPAQFERIIKTVSGETLAYNERSSPRSQVEGNIYTSTDLPAHQRIYFHNENSYASAWPLKIFFFCHTQPEKGGETPIADVRRVYDRIDPEIRARFEQKQISYVRNFGDGIGLPWQTVFNSSDKAEVEEYCRKTGTRVEWKGDGLRIARTGPAVAKHPVTGEMLWFNHGTFFHVSTLEERVRKALLSIYKEEDLPNNTYYGDGDPIEPEVLDHLRAGYDAEMVKFPWQLGDVLMLDNMLVAHAREPFSGPRKILVGMSQVISRDQLPAL